MTININKNNYKTEIKKKSHAPISFSKYLRVSKLIYKFAQKSPVRDVAVSISPVYVGRVTLWSQDDVRVTAELFQVTLVT